MRGSSSLALIPKELERSTSSYSYTTYTHTHPQAHQRIQLHINSLTHTAQGIKCHFAWVSRAKLKKEKPRKCGRRRMRERKRERAGGRNVEETELELQVSRVGYIVNKMRCVRACGKGLRRRRRLGGAWRLKCNKLNSKIFSMRMRQLDDLLIPCRFHSFITLSHLLGVWLFLCISLYVSVCLSLCLPFYSCLSVFLVS